MSAGRNIANPSVAIVLVSLLAAGCGSAAGSNSATSEATQAANAAGSPERTTQPTIAPVPLPEGVVRMLDLGPRPSGITAAGNVIWAEDHARTNKVYAIDPQSGELLATVDVRRPCDIAVLDDRLWIADLDVGKLVSVDLATRKINGEITRLAGPCGVMNINHTIWLAVDGGVARLDAAKQAVTRTELGDAGFPGFGDAPWVALYGSGDLVRLDPASGKATLTVKHPGGHAEGPALAVGHGSVWVGSSGRVYRLDPETGDVEAEIATAVPARFLVTSDAIWLTSYDGGMVERIDPATNKVVLARHLGGNINGITETDEGIWVADTLNGRLYLIDRTATGVTST